MTLGDLVLAGRGGIEPFVGTTPIVKNFYGFIPHNDLTGVTLTELGSATNVALNKTYKEGHYYAAPATHYTGMTLGAVNDGVDIVKHVNQPE